MAAIDEEVEAVRKLFGGGKPKAEELFRLDKGGAADEPETVPAAKRPANRPDNAGSDQRG